MEMGTKEKIIRIEPKGEVFACPACDYKDGFHVSFSWIEETSEGDIFLICPNCHRRFRIGWKIKREDIQ